MINTSRAPSFNNEATALDLIGNTLYVSGWFTRVGGVVRTLVTALDASTGADLGNVNLTFADTWNGGTLGVEETTIQPDGTDLVVIGNFRMVDGQPRSQVAMIDHLTGPAATLDTWHTGRRILRHRHDRRLLRRGLRPATCATPSRGGSGIVQGRTSSRRGLTTQVATRSPTSRSRTLPSTVPCRV